MFKKISENLWINQYGITAKTIENYETIFYNYKVTFKKGQTLDVPTSKLEATNKFTILLGQEDLRLSLSYEEAAKFIESYDEMFKGD